MAANIKKNLIAKLDKIVRTNKIEKVYKIQTLKIDSVKINLPSGFKIAKNITKDKPILLPKDTICVLNKTTIMPNFVLEPKYLTETQPLMSKYGIEAFDNDDLLKQLSDIMDKYTSIPHYSVEVTIEESSKKELVGKTFVAKLSEKDINNL